MMCKVHSASKIVLDRCLAMLLFSHAKYNINYLERVVKEEWSVKKQ